jgi:hypothetical protein
VTVNPTAGPVPRARQSPATIRTQLEELVVRNLLGPADGPEEEVAESRVSDRYVVGMLAPSKRITELDPSTDEELAEAGVGTVEDGVPETQRAPIESTFPSSFGLTVSLSPTCRSLKVTARWGRYERRDSETLKDEKTGNPQKVWKRIPMGGTITSIPLRKSLFKGSCVGVGMFGSSRSSS